MGVVSLEDSSAVDVYPKVIRWSQFEYSDPTRALVIAIPDNAQKALFGVVSRLVDGGVDHDAYEMTTAEADELRSVSEFGREVRRRLLNDTGAVLIRGLDMDVYGGGGGVDREMLAQRAKLAYYIISSFIGQVDAGARGRLFDVKVASSRHIVATAVAPPTTPLLTYPHALGLWQACDGRQCAVLGRLW